MSLASAHYYGNYNHTVCTQDVYVCPNGTTVGRTGSNCQFVCPSTTVINYSPSYSYTSGCYTYYYNGQTRTTSVLSYNCTSYYPAATTYTYPQTQYYTYHYTNNGYWTPGYNNTNYWTNPYSYNSNSYTSWNYGWNYGNNNTYGNNYNNSYTNYNNGGCYYVNGYQACP